MTFIRANRVKAATTITGTGDVAFSGSVAGYQTFGSVMATGDTCHYCIESVDGNGVPDGDWEVGLGTMLVSGDLERTTVFSSSNAGALVNLTAGTKNVFLTHAAEEAGMVKLLSFTIPSPTVFIDISLPEEYASFELHMDGLTGDFDPTVGITFSPDNGVTLYNTTGDYSTTSVYQQVFPVSSNNDTNESAVFYVSSSGFSIPSYVSRIYPGSAATLAKIQTNTAGYTFGAEEEYTTAVLTHLGRQNRMRIVQGGNFTSAASPSSDFFFTGGMLTLYGIPFSA